MCRLYFAVKEVLLSLPSLDIFNIEEAKIAAYRMQFLVNWWYHQASKHTQIDDNLWIDILGIMSNRMSKVADHEIPYCVNSIDRNEWSEGKPNYMRNALRGYKTSHVLGSDVYVVRPRENVNLSLKNLTTIFQVKISALTECVRRNINWGHKGKTIYSKEHFWFWQTTTIPPR